MADPNPEEPRQRAIGKTASGCYVFVVFVYRLVGGNVKISAGQCAVHASKGDRSL